MNIKFFLPGISEIERWGNKSRSDRARLSWLRLGSFCLESGDPSQRELLMGVDVDHTHALSSRVKQDTWFVIAISIGILQINPHVWLDLNSPISSAGIERH